MRTNTRNSAFPRALSAFAFWKASYLDLLQENFNFLVSVAEETGLSVTLPKTLKTGFVESRPISALLEEQVSILAPSLNLIGF